MFNTSHYGNTCIIITTKWKIKYKYNKVITTHSKQYISNMLKLNKLEKNKLSRKCYLKILFLLNYYLSRK